MNCVILATKRFIFNKLTCIFKKWYGQYPLTELEAKHIENCKIITDRIELLKLLPKNAQVAEIGVEEGQLSLEIMSICKPNNLELADWWLDKSAYSTTQTNKASFKNVKLFKMDSVEYLKSKETDTLDWVYIDTSHTYDTTKNELLEAKRVVKHNGLICGHDYTSVDYSGLKKYGVVEAVNEFCKSFDYQFIYLTHETSRHISFAIQKIG